MSRGAPVRLHKAPSATIRTARPTMASVTVASKGFFKIDSHSSCRQAVQAPLGDRLPPPPRILRSPAFSSKNSQISSHTATHTVHPRGGASNSTENSPPSPHPGARDAC